MRAAPRKTRKALAMDAAAAIVERDERASLAICRDFVDGEEVRVGGRVMYRRLTSEAFRDQSFYIQGVETDVKRRREVAGPSRRGGDWCLHELRDMGKLSRDLVDTGERFGAMHLELEPRTKCASFNDVRGGGKFDAAHVYHMERAHLSRNVASLYEAVAERVGAANVTVFAMAFSTQRASIAEIKAASGRDFKTICEIIERGLLKLWSLEAKLISHQQALTG